MDFRSLAYIKSDYYSALADYGYCHKDVCEQSVNESDMIKSDIEGIETFNSEIHGTGIISTKQFEFGDFIAIARAGEKRTIAGRFINHHPYPNAAYNILDNGDIIIIAISDIQIGDEITTNYRQIMSFTKHIQISNSSKEIDITTVDRKSVNGSLKHAYDLLINGDHISNMSLTERIDAFETNLFQYDQVEIPVKHEFIKGLYRREITFKKGTMATGKIHPDDHMDVLLSGKMAIATEDGYKIIEGPLCLTSKAGNKKAGIALEDTTWVSYHPTDKKTVEEVEKEIFTANYLHIDARTGA